MSAFPKDLVRRRSEQNGRGSLHSRDKILWGRFSVTVGSPLGPNIRGTLSADMSYRMTLQDSHDGIVLWQVAGKWYFPSITASLLSPPIDVSQGVKIAYDLVKDRLR